MRNSLLLKILSSLLVIFIALYFIPFLGVCLILLRYFVYDDKKRISIPIYIVGVGILILIPRGLNLILDILKIDLNVLPYLNDVVKTELYNVNFINYSKRLICVGGIFLIISFVLKTMFDKINRKIRKYIVDLQRRESEISKQNDMEIKIKQEKAKNTSYVKCPNCGSDNLLGGKFGICEYCRRNIENKNFKV